MYMDNKNLKDLHSKLQFHLEDQSKNYDGFIYAQKNGYYQGFEEIQIDGCRPTEKRFERYGIESYLSKDKKALDIGSNCGFFTLFVSKYVSNIDGVELNSYLVDIGDEVKNYLQIRNLEFFKSSFEEFNKNETYDVIFSLANDETIDGNTKFTFKEYIEKIIKLIKNNGYLMFETVSTDTYEPRIFLPKLEFLKKHFEVIEDKMVKSEYPINVPERRFLVLKKL
jgi:cyclopropane fatty-acyl-phospholipid synthase-like methyltransferase